LQDEDPFVIDELPNLYVVGCMEKYEKFVTNEGVCCITVPKFSNKGHSVVLVNRFTLESEIISFNSVI